MQKKFDTSTIEGIKKAERFQARMQDRFETVIVKPVGLSGVLISATNQPRRIEDR